MSSNGIHPLCHICRTETVAGDAERAWHTPATTRPIVALIILALT